MAWTTLPIENNVGADLSANMLANSVGTSLDDILDIALGVNSALSAGIGDIKTAWDDAIAALSSTYTLTLGTNNYSAPVSSTSAPDFSASFVSTITLPNAPTGADAPTVTDPSANFPAAPTVGTVPTISAAPTYAAITASFPTLPALPNAPTLDDPPTLATLPAMATAPTAPAVGGVLTTEYSDAYAIARQVALDTEANEVWDASYGAAASGRGLPLAAQQVAIQRAATKRLKATSDAALDMSRLRASHLREDTRWSYEQRLAYWAKIEDATLQRWQTEQTLKLTVWVQTVNGQLQIYSQFTDALVKTFSIVTDAEAKRITALLAYETLKLELWVKSNGAALDFWSKPLEVKASIFQTATQGEAARVQSSIAYSKLLVDAWAQDVDSEIKAYQAVSTATVSKAQASAAILAQRFASETARFGTTIQNLELGLREVAEKRQWFSADGDLKVKDAIARAQDAREIQKILVDTGEKALYAYAAALAEQLKALLSALSYQVQASASIRGASAITPA